MTSKRAFLGSEKLRALRFSGVRHIALRVLTNETCNGCGLSVDMAYPAPLQELGGFGRVFLHMSQDHLIRLKSTKSTTVYFTRKNRKKVERKIELKKYDPVTRKHEVFKEAKK